MDESGILAIKESIVLWERIAETGETKLTAICSLVDQQKLPGMALSYRNCCPLCERFLLDSFSDDFVCKSCPWPGEEERDYRCEEVQSSPFYLWIEAKDKTDRMKIGREMTVFLKELLRLEGGENIE